MNHPDVFLVGVNGASDQTGEAFFATALNIAAGTGGVAILKNRREGLARPGIFNKATGLRIVATAIIMGFTILEQKGVIEQHAILGVGRFNRCAVTAGDRTRTTLQTSSGDV